MKKAIQNTENPYREVIDKLKVNLEETTKALISAERLVIRLRKHKVRLEDVLRALAKPEELGQQAYLDLKLEKQKKGGS